MFQPEISRVTKFPLNFSPRVDAPQFLGLGALAGQKGADGVVAPIPPGMASNVGARFEWDPGKSGRGVANMLFVHPLENVSCPLECSEWAGFPA